MKGLALRQGWILGIVAVLCCMAGTGVESAESSSSWWPFSLLADADDESTEPSASWQEALEAVSQPLQRLQEIEGSADDEAAKAARLCQVGIDRLNFLEREIALLRDTLSSAHYRARRMEARAQRLSRDLQDLENTEAALTKAGEGIAKARDNALGLGRQVCDHTEQALTTHSYEDRQDAIDKALEFMRTLRRERREAQEYFQRMVVLIHHAQHVWREADALSREVDQLSQRLGQLEPPPRSLDGSLRQLTADMAQAHTHVEQLATLQDEAKGLVKQVRDKLEGYADEQPEADHILRETQALYTRLQVRRDDAQDCPTMVESRLQEASQRFQDAQDEQQALIQRLGEVWKGVSGSGAFQQAKGVWESAETQITQAATNRDSLEDRYREALLCLDLADRESRKPIHAEVPDVRGMDVDKAVQILEELNLRPQVVPGSPAPEEALFNKVEDQDPPSQVHLEVGEPVYLRVYQKAVSWLHDWKDAVMAAASAPVKPPKMPNVSGRKAKEAKQILEAAGFQAKMVIGSSAPLKNLEFTAYEQKEQEGNVKVKLYGAFEEAQDNANDFYLVCLNYFPNIDFSSLPEGARAKDYVVGLKADEIGFAPTQKPIVLHFSGEAAKMTPLMKFPLGKRIRLPFTMKFEDTEKDKTIYFSGVLLLEVLEHYTDLDTLKAAHQDEVESQILAISDDAGLFQTTQQQGNALMEIKGGPVAEDWNDAAKQANLDFYKAVISEFDCFIATAIYKDLAASELRALRRFRDQVMLGCAGGRRLVNEYYRLGPHWALFLKDHPHLERKLKPLVDSLAWVANRLNLDDPRIKSALRWTLDKVHGLMKPWLEHQEPQGALDVGALPQGVRP